MSVERCKHCSTVLIPIKTEKGYINYHMPTKDCKKDYLHAAIMLKLQVMDTARWEEYQTEWGEGTESVQELLEKMEEKLSSSLKYGRNLKESLIGSVKECENFQINKDRREKFIVHLRQDNTDLRLDLRLARRSPLTKLVQCLKNAIKPTKEETE